MDRAVVILNGPTPGVFARRRRRVLEQLDGGVLFIAGPSEATYSNDVHYRYRPETNIRFLSGFEEPCCLLLSASGAEPGLTLFVSDRDPAAETWTGKRAGLAGAREQYAADFAYPMADWPSVLERHLKETDRFFWSQGRDSGVNERVLSAIRAANIARPRNGRPALTVEDASLLLGELRIVKEAEETEIHRRACVVTAEAHREVMRTIRPGDAEFHAEALIEYLFRIGGCSGPAYPTIAAAGENAAVLHYTRNDRVLTDGDLLLIDAGGEFGGYASDVTRTFPVGSCYSPAQATLYEIVLSAQSEAIAAAVPGNSVDRIHRAALEVLVEGLVACGLIEGPSAEALESRTYERFYMHRTSHWLGMDVHDGGRYVIGDTPRMLTEGMVLTVEPGLYLPQDHPSEFRGIGIRIEDDVLITASGNEVLTAAAPKDRAEIEKIRKKAMSLKVALRAKP